MNSNPTTPPSVSKTQRLSKIEHMLRLMIIALHHSFALAPLLVIGCLYVFSWRAAFLIGHWPQPSIDDPKFIAPDCRICDALYMLTLPLLLWPFIALVAFPFLSLVLRRVYLWRWQTLLIIVFVVGWLLLIADPSERLSWYFD
ncbi:hypothetical protein F8S13_10795 [Chloroflexia bacterium SDU3-3]|nr:hypothetical protein F8S13_10795 [Chloroflexia bacterium SDU3-3]